MAASSSGKEVGLSPVEDSRLEWKAAHRFLLYAGIIMCNKCRLYSSVCVLCFCSSTRISYVYQDENTRQQQQTSLSSAYSENIFITSDISEAVTVAKSLFSFQSTNQEASSHSRPLHIKAQKHLDMGGGTLLVPFPKDSKRSFIHSSYHVSEMWMFEKSGDQLRFSPRHLTLVQKDEARCQ
ncbi:hypothetical protein TNCV_519021 [Trichonephila clavipes]|nr:hypothetical protein TNCV_519021 [Trichonephila clavipes]